VPAQVVELARLSGEEAQRALTIADSTLSFIRQTARPELIDLRSAAESVGFLLAPVIRQKSITFQIESHGDCTVEGYAGEIRQVLLNVIRNACEAVTKPGTRVTIQLDGDERGITMSVTDQGLGIEPELLPTIFEFGVTTKGAQGNGMGLWTVKRIVTKHHGEVKVASRPGEGTRVDLWWPRNFSLNFTGGPATA
jgi:signal transduction histidine kinase